MLHEILRSVVVALIVSAVGAVGKWLWKSLRRISKQSNGSGAQNTHPLLPIKSLRYHFFTWLAVLIVSNAVFFPVLVTGNMERHPVLGMLSLIGMFFSFIFLWGSFDHMTIHALNQRKPDHKNDLSDDPPNRRADDPVAAQHSK